MTEKVLVAKVLDKLAKEEHNVTWAEWEMWTNIPDKLKRKKLKHVVVLSLQMSGVKVAKAIEEVYAEVLYEITRSQCGTGEWANNSQEFQRGFECGVMVLQRETTKRLGLLQAKEVKK